MQYGITTKYGLHIIEIDLFFQLRSNRLPSAVQLFNNVIKLMQLLSCLDTVSLGYFGIYRIIRKLGSDIGRERTAAA